MSDIGYDILFVMPAAIAGLLFLATVGGLRFRRERP